MTVPEGKNQEVEPLFTIDLGTNGGVVAPKSHQELQEWTHKETSLWAWMARIAGDTHYKAFVLQAYATLRVLDKRTRVFLGGPSNPASPEFQANIAAVQAAITETFSSKKWPHSSNITAKRAAELASEDPTIGVAYLFVQLNPGTTAQFDGKDIPSIRGFFIGLIERYGSLSGDNGLAASRAAFEELSNKLAEFLRESSTTYDAIRQSYLDAAARHDRERQDQHEQLNKRIADLDQAFNELAQRHSTEMESMRKAFREGMALRGPVEYWTKKAAAHERKAKSLLGAVFGTLILTTIVIASVSAWSLLGLAPDTKPDAAKVAILVLVGVMGIWGLRLVVRMWLSHTHLATDASERVTMVQTYLAMLEGEKMPSDEDRKLVLAPLFRPAADGLVKDEGLPHPMLEFLTRSKN